MRQLEQLREMVVEEKGPLARATNMHINSLATDIQELRSCLIATQLQAMLTADNDRIDRILERTK